MSEKATLNHLGSAAINPATARSDRIPGACSGFALFYVARLAETRLIVAGRWPRPIPAGDSEVVDTWRGWHYDAAQLAAPKC